MTGDTAVRKADDIGGQELSYAEVKAIASGNPAVLTLAQADADLQRLTLLKKNHLDEQYVARRNVKNLPTTITGLTERLAHLTTDQTTASAYVGDPVTVGNRVCSPENALTALGRLLDTLPYNVRELRRVSLGVYRGLKFGVVLHPHFPPDVYLEGAATRRSMLSKEHQGPRAVLNAAERLASSYDSECERVQEDLRIAESQFRDYRTRLDKPFLHNAYLSELTALRDELKVRLSGSCPNTNSESVLDTRELARRIKALIENQTTTATAERPGRRHVSAEEPITLRIRRRTENTDDPVQNAEAS
jgi:hypothetical protein